MPPWAPWAFMLSRLRVFRSVFLSGIRLFVWRRVRVISPAPPPRSQRCACVAAAPEIEAPAAGVSGGGKDPITYHPPLCMRACMQPPPARHNAHAGHARTCPPRDFLSDVGFATSCLIRGFPRVMFLCDVLCVAPGDAPRTCPPRNFLSDGGFATSCLTGGFSSRHVRARRSLRGSWGRSKDMSAAQLPV